MCDGTFKIPIDRFLKMLFDLHNNFENFLFMHVL